MPSQLGKLRIMLERALGKRFPLRNASLNHMMWGPSRINAATNTIRSLYHKDLYQKKWPKTIFTGRGAQGNHIGHKRILIEALICEKIHTNTLQIPYWFQRCSYPKGKNGPVHFVLPSLTWFSIH
jgi:hypothetical protein